MGNPSITLLSWDLYLPMSAVYDDVEIEDMEYDEEKKTYYYPCPCGDKFFITLVRAGMTLFVVLPRFSCSLAQAVG